MGGRFVMMQSIEIRAGVFAVRPCDDWAYGWVSATAEQRARIRGKAEKHFGNAAGRRCFFVD